MIIEWFNRVFLGKNTLGTSIEVISAQLNEPRPLPNGMLEWKEWSDRILSGVVLDADRASLEFILSNLILGLGPTESHKPDAFFIHSLRKAAANQVAAKVRDNIREEGKARLAKEEAEKALLAKAANPQAEATLERAKGLSLVKATEEVNK